jgi:ubiquinone/menaquinone biosynthesis C-methylase UbiE
MGWWSEHVVPRVVDLTLDNDQVRELRARVCAGLRGRVLEVGFGSGLNVPHYPRDVESVTAVEPSDLAWSRAGPRLRRTRVVVRRAGLDGQRLPLPDASHDSALSTFTLCTIPDVDAALAEIHRVLKPGGRLELVEHGLSPDGPVAAWQHRLDGLQGRLAGGCHLDRPIDELIRRNGFTIGHLETFYAPGPKPFAYLYLGWATAG